MRRLVLASMLLVAFAAAPVSAQPWDAWMTLAGQPNVGYIRVPSAAALKPTGALTIEAWVNVTDTGGCSSIIGKNYIKAWWIGICGQTLRSYVRGYNGTAGGGPGTFRDGGDLPPSTWTHIAVVFNGTQRLHYVNGELAASWAEAGPLTVTDDPIQIGSDVSWDNQPAGAIDEIRFWNVARTQTQIRAWINERVRTAQPGLVAVWTLDATAQDVIGPHDGTVVGTGVGALTFPAGPTGCSGSATQLCLAGRFSVTGRHRAGGAPGSRTTGTASVAVNSAGSGIFYFFNSDNWEVMVKALNGCGLTNHWWIYTAATTDVFYRLQVFDNLRRESKIYFNYPGPPAPAVTDAFAFETCP